MINKEKVQQKLITNKNVIYKSSYFKIAVNNFYPAHHNTTSANSLSLIKFVNVNKRFFYGLIRYIYKYDTFRLSLLNFFIQLIEDLNQLQYTILKPKTKNNTELLMIEINFKFLTKYLNQLYNNNLNTKVSEIKNSTDIRYFKSLKIVGINLVEHDEIIRAWSSIVLSWLNKKYKYDSYWAFFSTLGGAYSSLGEDIYEHALNAERISIKQLVLAQEFNDPNAICRCKIFLAFSYTQLKKFKKAKLLLKNEYNVLKNPIECKKAGITDDRLRVMSIAGLKKLNYVKSL